MPRPTTIEEADAQRERASEMRGAAKKRYERESAACYKKFLVNDCLNEAKKRRTQTMIEARHLDAPAREFQQNTKRADAAAKAKQRETDRIAREAEQTKSAEDFHVKEASEAEQREAKLSKRDIKAAKARQKSARDAAKRKERQKGREKRDTERAAKKAREEAAIDARIDARTPKP
ncbi:MAG: hypothetical protein LBJ76_02620 [Candidatus Accumulibacter sp.]|nr:hypothetical protein [Accumulibacter sp.]